MELHFYFNAWPQLQDFALLQPLHERRTNTTTSTWFSGGQNVALHKNCTQEEGREEIQGTDIPLFLARRQLKSFQYLFRGEFTAKCFLPGLIQGAHHSGQDWGLMVIGLWAFEEPPMTTEQCEVQWPAHAFGSQPRNLLTKHRDLSTTKSCTNCCRSPSSAAVELSCRQ